MVCVGTGVLTELAFVQSLGDRVDGMCRGPLTVLTLRAYRLSDLENAFDSDRAHALLWSGFLPTGRSGLMFGLCAIHWLDLAGLVMTRGVQQRRQDLVSDATTLLRWVCTAAGWDVKEISNLLRWQRVRLT